LTIATCEDDIFLAKYDTSGNVLWAKSADGTGDDGASSVAVDASGNIYVVGYFGDTLTFGSTTLTNAGHYDIFLVKYDTSGNMLWAKSAGGTGDDNAYSVTVDASGNSYVAGSFLSPTLTFGSTTLTNASSDGDIFLAKYDASGNVLWAKSAGGTDGDVASSVAVDASGNTYVAGWFYSPTLTFGSTTLTNTNVWEDDIFLAKYDANGNVLWAKSAGGTDDDVASSVAVDASGNTYVAGWFYSPTITFGSSTLTNTNVWEDDIFLAKYDANGNVLWAKSAGGTDDDGASSVAVDASGNTYVAGWFLSPTITFGSTTLTYAGSGDIFLAKLSSNTGINELSNSLNILVFPNPASDNLTIETLQKSEIEISNIQRQLIKTLATNAGKTNIDVSAFPSGMYFLEVKTGKGIEVRKFIKE